MNKKKVKQPVRLTDLPEYQDAVEWACSIRAKAEKEIARRAVEAPFDVLERIDALVTSGNSDLTPRERDAVGVWSGVGTTRSTLNKQLEAIAMLPGRGNDVQRWWMAQARNERVYGGSVNFWLLKEGHYIKECETEELLGGVLRKCLASLIDDMPSVVRTYLLLQEFLTVMEEDRQVRLSEVTRIQNSFAWRRGLIGDGLYDPNTDKASYRSVSQARTELLNAGLEFETDCGLIEGAQSVRDALERYGERVRGCETCQHWHVVPENDAQREWRRDCPYCEIPFAFSWNDRMSAFDNSQLSEAEKILRSARAGVEKSVDLIVKVALAEGATVNHARRLLAGSEECVADAVSDLKVCPLSEGCRSLCGDMQRKGALSFPIAPYSGDYRECEYYAYTSMTPDDADDDVRQRIGDMLLARIEERRERKGGILAAGGVDALEQQSVPVENRISLQAALF